MTIIKHPDHIIYTAIENDDINTIINTIENCLNDESEYEEYNYYVNNSISIDIEFKSALSYACALNKIKIIKFLLNNTKFKKELYYVDKYDYEHISAGTCLHCACKYGAIDAIKLLLSETDINPEIEYHYMTPLHIACSFGQIEAVKLLCNDSRVNVNSNSYGTPTPIFKACFNNHYEVVRYLLNNLNVDPTIISNQRGTLFHAAAHSCEITKLLLEDGRIDPNICDPCSDDSPICRACRSSNFKNVLLLLEHPSVNIEGALTSICYSFNSYVITDHKYNRTFADSNTFYIFKRLIYSVLI